MDEIIIYALQIYPWLRSNPRFTTLNIRNQIYFIVSLGISPLRQLNKNNLYIMVMVVKEIKSNLPICIHCIHILLFLINSTYCIIPLSILLGTIIEETYEYSVDIKEKCQQISYLFPINMLKELNNSYIIMFSDSLPIINNYNYFKNNVVEELMKYIWHPTRYDRWRFLD